jgi:uncharacterized membrane protein YgdD (TMEM256/DUF423 family)
MFTKTHSDTLKSTVCMLLAAVIVSASLTLGAFGIHSLEQDAIASLALRS